MSSNQNDNEVKQFDLDTNNVMGQNHRDCQFQMTPKTVSTVGKSFAAAVLPTLLVFLLLLFSLTICCFNKLIYMNIYYAKRKTKI